MTGTAAVSALRAVLEWSRLSRVEISNAARIAGKALVGGAYQGEVLLEGQREHDPAIDSLEDVAPVVLEQPPDHDVAALVEPKFCRR